MILTKKQVDELFAINKGGLPSNVAKKLGIKSNKGWKHQITTMDIDEKTISEVESLLIKARIKRDKVSGKKTILSDRLLSKYGLFELDSSNIKNGSNKWNAKNVIKRKLAGPSFYEKIIMSKLSLEKIPFIREHIMEGLVSKSKNNLFFDFYLPQYNLVIEYDGEHHTDDSNKNIKDNDLIKDNFCLKNKINIIRISSKDKEEIIDSIMDKIKSLVKLFDTVF